MGSIFVTGDIHGTPSRLSNKRFFADMDGSQDENFVIIAGDFGLVWDYEGENSQEKYWLKWLERKPFTTLFVDGNHECFDRLYSFDQYPVEEWHGGLVQKIRPHVIHLMRGECYDILGKKVFAFGGAASHDINDGILNKDDTETIRKWRNDATKMFRINHVSWWKEEMASKEEMRHGLDTLRANDNKVDFIITHCAPSSLLPFLGFGLKKDEMTEYFDKISKEVEFSKWIHGHYHEDMDISGPRHEYYHCVYDSIFQIA